MTTIILSSTIVDVIAKFSDCSLMIPEYQRTDTVWRKSSKCLLLDSVFLDLPIPPLWIAGPLLKGELIDGLQRLTTLKQFRDGKLEYTTNNIKLTRLNNCRWKDLNKDDQIRFDSYPLSYFSIDTSQHGDKIGQHMFYILNQGEPLSSIEGIDGQNLGNGRDLIHELSTIASQFVPISRWRNISRRKDDKALICYALIGLLGELKEYNKKGIDEWGCFGIPMREGRNNPGSHIRTHVYSYLNKLNDEELNNIKVKFTNAVKAISRAINSDEIFSKVGPKVSPRFNNIAALVQFYMISRIGSDQNWYAANKYKIREILTNLQEKCKFLNDRLSLENCIRTVDEHVYNIFNVQREPDHVKSLIVSG